MKAMLEDQCVSIRDYYNRLIAEVKRQGKWEEYQAYCVSKREQS